MKNIEYETVDEVFSKVVLQLKNCVSDGVINQVSNKVWDEIHDKLWNPVKTQVQEQIHELNNEKY